MELTGKDFWENFPWKLKKEILLVTNSERSH